MVMLMIAMTMASLDSESANSSRNDLSRRCSIAWWHTL